MEEGKEEQDVENKPVESGLSWEPLRRLGGGGTRSPQVLLRL